MWVIPDSHTLFNLLVTIPLIGLDTVGDGALSRWSSHVSASSGRASHSIRMVLSPADYTLTLPDILNTPYPKYLVSKVHSNSCSQIVLQLDTCVLDYDTKSKMLTRNSHSLRDMKGLLQEDTPWPLPSCSCSHSVW